MLNRETIETTIGKSFADRLEEVIIDAGPKLVITRRTLVEELGCANFVAAARLNKALKKLSIETPAQLFRTDPFSIARLKGVGESTIYVAMCILDAAQYSVTEWWGWKETNKVKFSTFKHNAIHRASKNAHE